MRQMKAKAVVLVGVILLAGCGKSPESVVDHFYRDVEKGEISNAKQYVSKHIGELLGDRKLTEALSGETARISACGGISSIDAQIQKTGEVANGETTVTFKGKCKARKEKTHLVKEEGAWKIGANK